MNKKITSRNAAFQQWQSYLTNRSKRTKAGRFLIQGVRPITLAAEHDWPIEALLYRDGGGALSSWAHGVLDGACAEQIAMSPELIAELGEKSDVVPEVVAVAKARTPDLRSWRPVGAAPVIVVFDRPASPGNLGTLIRSADAFGAEAVVVAGHGADQFDPQAVRASTGSVFALPVFRVADAQETVAFGERAGLTVVGTDEDGSAAIYEHDFTAGTILVVGNETRGMSTAWRDACDVTVRIPIGGAASSLGAPSAGAVCLYEIARQRAR